MQTTVFYLGRFLKKLADDQCSSIAKGSIYHITHMYIHPFTTVVDWPEIECLMEVSTMFYICRYCIFTWDGRIPEFNFDTASAIWRQPPSRRAIHCNMKHALQIHILYKEIKFMVTIKRHQLFIVWNETVSTCNKFLYHQCKKASFILTELDSMKMTGHQGQMASIFERDRILAILSCIQQSLGECGIPNS